MKSSLHGTYVIDIEETAQLWERQSASDFGVKEGYGEALQAAFAMHLEALPDLRLTINDKYLLVASAEGEDPCLLLSDPSDSTMLRIDWFSLPVSFEVSEVAPDCFHFDSPNHQISKAIWRRLPRAIDE